jgi:hypothetical protein
LLGLLTERPIDFLLVDGETLAGDAVEDRLQVAGLDRVSASQALRVIGQMDLAPLLRLVRDGQEQADARA